MASPENSAVDLAAAAPLVLYDGVCGLCNRFVRFVIWADRSQRFRFATLQGVYGQAMRRAHPELGAVDSIVVLDGGTAHIKSDAALHVIAAMGGLWPMVGLARLVPRLVGDAVYDAVARSRYRVFGRFDSCPLPSSGERARFLD